MTAMRSHLTGVLFGEAESKRVLAERIRARINRLGERETARRDVRIEVVRTLEVQPRTFRVHRPIEGVH